MVLSSCKAGQQAHHTRWLECFTACLPKVNLMAQGSLRRLAASPELLKLRKHFWSS